MILYHYIIGLFRFNVDQHGEWQCDEQIVSGYSLHGNDFDPAVSKWYVGNETYIGLVWCHSHEVSSNTTE